jgi:CRAL/TRIO domain
MDFRLASALVIFPVATGGEGYREIGPGKGSIIRDRIGRFQSQDRAKPHHPPRRRQRRFRKIFCLKAKSVVYVATDLLSFEVFVSITRVPSTMGFYCCRSDDRDPSASVSKTALHDTATTATAGSISRLRQPPRCDEEPTLSLFVAGKVVKEQHGQEEEGEGFEMFHDALQSFSEMVGSMSYPPTATMRKSVIVVDDKHVRRVSMQQPSTLLLSTSLDENDIEAPEAAISKTKPILRQSVIQVTNKLQEPSPGCHGQGYPGSLSPEELEACLEFRQRLKEGDAALKEMVYVFVPVEEESFALCRILRGEAFVVDNVFAKFQEKNVVAMWKRARQEQFWNDFQAHFHCPLAVFLKLFPIVTAGLAKNGCTLMYLKAGEIDIDGIECIADLPTIMPYIWHILHEKSKDTMKREMGQKADENTTVLAEKIAIIDMQGAPSALFGSRGMEFLKDAAKASACFPEILNRMYLVNVPFTFSVIWAVLKLFIDPRTIRKIGFFSNASKAKKDILQYVPSEQLLSDYGGQGPSFQQSLETRQQEYGEHFRYVVKTVSLSLIESNFSFELLKGEQIADVTVYSQSDGEARFAFKKNETTIGEPVSVSRKASGSDRNHYSVNIAGLPFPSGPSTFAVHSKLADGAVVAGSFVVAISISSAN